VALISSHMLRQRLEDLREKYAHQRRIAHLQAVNACMVQLDEVEAFAEEQEAALLSDRAQVAALGDLVSGPRGDQNDLKVDRRV
jgi:hypothetical protein